MFKKFPVSVSLAFWAHVRRRFVEAEPHYPEAGEMVDRIGQFCAIAYLREATLRAIRNPGTVTLAPDLKSSES